LDIVGFLLFSTALTGLLYGLDHIISAAGAIALGIAALAAGLFVPHALHRQEKASSTFGFSRTVFFP